MGYIKINFMKKMFLIILIFTAMACKKEQNGPLPDNATPLIFTSITVGDSILYVNVPTTLTANATGDDLTYKWSAAWGTFIGSGRVVQWSACHADKFTITCKVTDKYDQSQTVNLDVKVK